MISYVQYLTDLIRRILLIPVYKLYYLHQEYRVHKIVRGNVHVRFLPFAQRRMKDGAVQFCRRHNVKYS